MEIAFKYLEKQCAFGERYPGSENHIKMKDYFKNLTMIPEDAKKLINEE